MYERMNTLELFAGIGGLSLGLERAGFSVAGQVEIDPWARGVLARHWPEVPKHDDVRTALDWWRSEPRPDIDLVAGGYPCQGESLAGRRKGSGDDRWLWPEFARIVSALRPRYVLGENVIGHRTSGLRFVLRDLELLGYIARAGTLSAGEVGAPHQRKRIFVLAERRDLADAERESRDARGSGDTGEGTQGWDADRGGVTRHVADAAGSGRDAGAGGERDGAQRGQGQEERDVPTGRGAALADAGGAGLEGQGEFHRTGAISGLVPAHVRREGSGDFWTVEPDVGRVAHGVPDRVDRLRGLGNAVVPAVAEHIGRLLLSGKWK